MLTWWLEQEIHQYCPATVAGNQWPR